MLDRAMLAWEDAERRAPSPTSRAAEERLALQVRGHRQQGERLARAGDIEKAVAELQLAAKLAHQDNYDAHATAREFRIEAIRMKAHKLLLEERISDATKVLQSLSGLVPDLSVARELEVLALPDKEGPALRDLIKYLTKRPHKAFVYSSIGSWGWAAGEATIEQAIEAALEYCTRGGISTREQCRVYAKENEIIGIRRAKSPTP